MPKIAYMYMYKSLYTISLVIPVKALYNLITVIL